MKFIFISSLRKLAQLSVYVSLLALSSPAYAAGEVAQRLMLDLQQDFSITNEQAAGMVGNFAAETGNFTQMQEGKPRSGRGGYGYAQWTASRRVDYENWAADNGYTDLASYDSNYGFLKHELTTTYKSSISNLRNTSTASEAALQFESDFEKAGTPRLGARTNFAEQFADGNFAGGGSYIGDGSSGDGMGDGTGDGTSVDSLKYMILMPWTAVDTTGVIPPGVISNAS